jgi:hypothetical protein
MRVVRGWNPQKERNQQMEVFTNSRKRRGLIEIANVVISAGSIVISALSLMMQMQH